MNFHRFSIINPLIISRQGLGELQTKLANLILGLKTQPELDQLVQDSSRAHAPLPETTQWGQGHTGGDGGTWGGGGGSGSGGWGDASPSRGGSSTAAWGGGNASPARGGSSTAWGVSPNVNGADTAQWGAGSAGWQSPNQKTNTGWNI